ncbi:hypothetical protein FB45DRAFT_1140798 [Roridomyces roridus]|uniref:Uncharacterized protein n=1 Tax=Roridomyces roridus TaxID=1738132 RepID=A0AAD7F6U7_9AGAR|nr:hypothetical protein FB45DRAFT_1140798 [Roridomyces roridus]
MGRTIPDEMIHEILSPALSVSDETFSVGLPRSPSVPCLESSSAILLVCKAWLRVATPLLYHTVILRSKGQAQALSVALRCNPDLGFRKLRLQSGYGSSLHQILRTTTKLTDIFIPLEFDEGDDACSLCRGLPLIDPVRVIVSYDPFEAITPEPVDTLVGVLVEYIPKWNNLATFEMPHDWPDDEAGHNETFSSPLKVAPNLRTLVLSYNARDLFRDGIMPEYISRVAQNASLQEIRAKTRSRKVLKPVFFEAVRRNARLQELIDPNLFGPKNAFVYPPPLAANPAVADVIWDRVLYYVFREDDDEFHGDGDESDYDSDDEEDRIPQRWDPLRVSKQFMRLGTPHFYDDIFIGTCESMRLFTGRLLREPSLGAHICSLYIGSQDEHTINDLQIILSLVPRLKELSSEDGLNLPWHMFEALSIRYGSHLVLLHGITITQCPDKADPIVFHRLSRLQGFTWKSDTEFHTTATFAASDTFNKLKDLIVTRAHPSFFILLSRLQLSSLKSMILYTTKVDAQIFFEMHGAKLSELYVGAPAFNLDMFNFCPHVKVLNICIASKDEQSVFEGVLKRCHTHSSLEIIVIDPKGFDAKQYAEKSELLELFEVFLAEFDPRPFPALREIRHLYFDWYPPLRSQISTEHNTAVDY